MGTTMTQKRTRLKRILVAMVAIFALGISPAAEVYADQFDDQIKALEGEVARYQQEAGKLRAEADTLQNQLNALTAEKNALIEQINLNEAKLKQLQDQIKQTEIRLENQKILLAGNLRSMYLESTVSPLEMIASSKSISDFIDKQEYRNTIREQVQRSMDQIKVTKQELETQHKDVERTLADQKTQKEQLVVKENERATLLAQTQGQEASYQNLAKERNAKISELRAQQAAANRRFFGSANVVPGDPGRGGYPNYLYSAPQDSLVDPWGMYNRECVSYTAWKVHQKTGRMPYWGGVGNANQWPGNADNAGIARGSAPRAGSVAVSMAGPYGHTMWVEAVLEGGSKIYVSQFNAYINGQWGEYSEAVIPAGGLIYIYF